MKKAIKTILAVSLGIVILDVFCMFYYNPTGYVPSGHGATDLVREEGAFTSRATEGIAWMRMDENGYNNPSVPEEISVLMMGSSHTEALNVMPDENSAAYLSEMLSESSMADGVYNIGMSSHTLVRNMANFARALDEFESAGYAVMETADVIMWTASLYEAIEDRMEPLPATGIDMPGLLTDRPLLRTLYRQYKNLTGEEHQELYADYIPEDTMARYEEALTQAFQMLKTEADARGVGIIVYYHPHLTLEKDGGVTPATQAQCLEAFARSCAAAEVTFIDMTDIFLREYEENAVLPHGFSNTTAGAGHLNPAGHRMIAEEIFRVICEKEAAR